MTRNRSHALKTSVVMLVVTAVVFVVAFSVRASLINQATYTLTRHKISTLADHEASFQTPSGVDSSADTITLTYPAGFSFGSVGVGDIDLFHGPTTGLETNETLAASASGGVWGVNISGSIITFTAPTDSAGGEIAINDFVLIRIGANASGGTNQITNPASAQQAQIVLGGTFGDTGTMTVPIVGDDQVIVSATVVGGVPPVVPPPTPQPSPTDVMPPVISNVQVINISTSTATITWSTNESSDSKIEYGITAGYGSGTASNSSLVTQHSLILTNLTPATVYHFRVSSKDSSNNQAVSVDYTFATLGDIVPPVISNVQIVDITDVSARVTWKTNELADSKVNYGTTTFYGLYLTKSGFVTQHSILITGLKPSTLYHLFVTSKDQSNNTATSTDRTFVTLADVTPSANVSNFKAVGEDGVVKLSWTMPPDPDLAGVIIVRKQGGYPANPDDGVFVYSGKGTSTKDSNVVNGITYFYGAFSFDFYNNFSSGALAMATPEGPIEIVPENTDSLCSNGIDDDSDGLVDCFDADCSRTSVCALPIPPVSENTNAACSNGIDDDGDGLRDCADPDCFQIDVCKIPVPLPPEPALPLPPAPPTVPVPIKPVPTPVGEIVKITPAFYGAGGTVQLIPDSLREFGTLSGSAVLVSVPTTGLGVEPKVAYLTVGGSVYNLALNSDGTGFEGAFVAPSFGSYAVSVSMTFQGGGAAVEFYSLLSQSGGRVVEEFLTKQGNQGIAGATVRLFVDQGGWVLWNGAPYNQSNPQLTGVNGGYAFIVPNGIYFLEVEKSGFITKASPERIITKNVIGELIGLVSVPPPPVIKPEVPILENVVEVTKNVAKQAVASVTEVRAFIQQPEVQKVVEETVSPAVLGVAIINVSTALPLFNILTYLQFLFTQPILLLDRFRKKKRKWGVVYNTLTKMPVDLAIVRLQQHPTKLSVQTKVTDKHGRYSFIPKPGNYVLDVVKPAHTFPTQYLKGKASDLAYTDLYHGAPVAMTPGKSLAFNVPIDPIEKAPTPRKIMIKKVLSAVQGNIALLSVTASGIAFVVTPRISVGAMFLVQIGAYFVFRRLGAPTKPKDWGAIYDRQTKQPLSRVVVRIFDKQFNKLLETQVTDKSGKYGFLVRRNVYYITAELLGYEKYTSPDIDLSGKDEALVDQNIVLKKGSSLPAQPIQQQKPPTTEAIPPVPTPKPAQSQVPPPVPNEKG